MNELFYYTGLIFGAVVSVGIILIVLVSLLGFISNQLKQ